MKKKPAKKITIVLVCTAVAALVCGTLFAYYGPGWGGGFGFGYGPGPGYGYYGYGYDAGAAASAAAVGAAGNIVGSAIVASEIRKANETPEQIEARADAKDAAEQRRLDRKREREERKEREREAKRKRVRRYDDDYNG